MPHFNSIKVRLKRWCPTDGSPLLPFQFHKGTIKTYDADFILIIMTYFNSIKVRLKPVIRLTTADDYPLFQFHKGTIKTRAVIERIRRVFDFNSIKVRLKLQGSSRGLSVHPNFNSIKVRLKLWRFWRQTKNGILFQFHKGTIKTIFLYFCPLSRKIISIP